MKSLDGLFEWQCQACGFEFNEEETTSECPQCSSEDIIQIGDSTEEKSV